VGELSVILYSTATYTSAVPLTAGQISSHHNFSAVL
jgi:hypothetical protein